MVQLVKCLPHKWEDLDSGSQNPDKKPGVVACTYSLSDDEMKDSDRKTGKLASLACPAKFQVSKRPISNRTLKACTLRNDTHVICPLISDMYSCTHTHTSAPPQTYTHTPLFKSPPKDFVLTLIWGCFAVAVPHTREQRSSFLCS